jgi:hypothetical protein
VLLAPHKHYIIIFLRCMIIGETADATEIGKQFASRNKF